MFLEYDLAHQLDFTNIVIDFASVKSRTQGDKGQRQIDTLAIATTVKALLPPEPYMFEPLVGFRLALWAPGP